MSDTTEKHDSAGSPAQEEALVKRFNSGDSNAFSEIVERFQRPVFSVVYRMVGNVEDAEDVVQDTFVKIYRHLGSFEGRSRLSTWLFQIAINRARNFLRRGKIARFVPLPAEEMPGTDSGTSPEGPVIARETLERLHLALGRIPAEQREVFVLREMEELSYREIAEALGVPLGTVMSRLSRARDALQGDMKGFL